ncbi:MAG TPA: metallophosphoesterase family protein, partial [Candidatus Hydrogenedentes bacterium]|nr:metallophosphoesterase family protein [Candidatus Hydrogenedentota bacterium]
FRIAPWDASRDVAYRVAHGTSAFYSGTIRRDPVDKDEIVVAAFTGNSIHPQHGGDIPKTDIVENIKRLRPDLLFFSGDQVYDHAQHYAAWLKFGRDFGEIIKDTPTITIPDDHDVGQSNLWGAGGKASQFEAGHDGGYFRPVEYVNEVQRAQTSHLPDPYDPTPVERGITVYYTALTWGRVSFAIIEDRKWKSGPQGLVPQLGPRPDHINDPDYDPSVVDVPGATLLGGRQIAFLRAWTRDWTDADMKAVLSQTIFCGGAHLHGKRDNRLVADLDSNGWPQRERNRALAEIRKSFSVMIAGDQHLGTIVHHGIEGWNDAGYSFCVPSIANLYLRWWAPLKPGRNRAPGMPEHTGEFKDGLGNRITVWAVANPSPEENHDLLTTRAAGFGVVRFHKKTREITFECWPRSVDVTAPEARQYPGWPKTIRQEDNYAAKPYGYLPELAYPAGSDPVLELTREADGELVYALRLTGSAYRPKVFAPGTYTVTLDDGRERHTMRGLSPAALHKEIHSST